MTRSTAKFLAAALALGVGTAGIARAAEPSPEELRQQIQQLQTKVDQLEAKQQQQAAAPTTDATAATIDNVMRDAEKQSKMMAVEGFTAGYNNGRFTIQDAEGNFVLRPTFQFQLRNASNWRQDGPIGGGGADFNNGFEIPRMKVGFDGNAFTPKLTYYFLWNTNETTGAFGMEQAWAKWNVDGPWSVRAGQIINPTVHEQAIGSRTQLAVDRSLMNNLLTGIGGEARTQAATGIYDDPSKPITAEFGITDGFNSQNTDFLDPAANPANNNWGVFGRVNYFFHGPHGEYNDFTALNNKENLLVAGGGLDVTQTGGDTNYIHTADVQWENTTGWGAYAALLGNYVTNSSIDGGNHENWGLLVQGSYLFRKNMEVFGRFDYTKLSSALVAPLDDNYSELTAGVNWYIWGNHTKFTVDVGILPNGSPVSIPIEDVLASDSTEIIVRGQFQLLL
jgi:hypothetical protein